MPTPTLDPNTLRCPSCGDASLRLSRRHRRGNSGTGASLGPVRYRCRAEGCTWRGSLLPTPLHQTAAEAASAAAGVVAAVWRARPVRHALVGLTVLAGVGVVGAALLVTGLETWGRHAAGLDPARGQSHDGLPLARASLPQGGQLLRAAAGAQANAAAAGADTPVGQVPGAAGLALRQGCAWGQPGRNPYRGSTEQALQAAGLPPEVVRQIAAQRQAGQKVGRLKISRDAIRLEDGSREFNPRQIAMSFGQTLCLNTRVNFAPGHVEAADLYEARDAQGRVHAVMVPDVCGNVSVLGTRRQGGVVAGVAGSLADRSLALAAVADALALDGAGAAGASPNLDPGAGGGGQSGRVEAGASDGRANAAEEGDVADSAGAVDTGRRGTSSGGTSSGGAGGEGAGQVGGGHNPVPAPAPRIERVTTWADAAGGGWLPRGPLVAGLKTTAQVLALAGSAVAALPGHGGEVGAGQLSTRQNTADPRSLPEPGTLLCVLGALAGLVWVGRRRRGR